jgi:(1->4)-alpha-D-glucan 1-alpha-D-glucosylmutase
MDQQSGIAPRIPSSTYRLQFHKGFTLRDALPLVTYWHRLGITDLYCSPLLKSRSGSLHGYDVTDHSVLNPEIGTETDLAALSDALRARDMGLLCDVVPNHMCVDPTNRWWVEVLENGPSSPYANYFDIDWHPLKSNLDNKVLLPVLGDQYGKILENGELQVRYDAGAFEVFYYQHRFPLAPKTWTVVLTPLIDRLAAAGETAAPTITELRSIVTAIDRLPSVTEKDPAKVKERFRDKEIIKTRLAAVTGKNEAVASALTAGIAELNGRKGEPRSFDALEGLLERQSYRLCYWRVATDEINFRRFFDINELAALRVEDDAVFDEVHRYVVELARRGWVTGFRIDHVDGLSDPTRYLRSLQSACLQALTGAAPNTSEPFWDRNALPFYVVVEKILGVDEPLPSTWAAHGTTGYDYLNALNGVFVDKRNAKDLRQAYDGFIGRETRFRDIVITCKKLIMLVSMSSELHMLASWLDRISEQHRWSRDFTLDSLRFALREVIAAFPVYRSYIRLNPDSVHPEDRKNIEYAAEEAKRRNPSTEASVFDFIKGVLLLEDPDGLTEEHRLDRRNFVLRFQQITGPVMAKGLEDTSFYRYFPLASLNEVGGDPDVFGYSPEQYHQYNKDRAENWPHGLCASTTHDTKRSEDVRARINVLSEMPREWERAVKRWQFANRNRRAALNGTDAPDANEEYLLYQTILGALPGGRGDLSEGVVKDPATHTAFIDRIKAYMMKALKEAKIHTSWIQPNEKYEAAVSAFIDAILKPDASNLFLDDLFHFSKKIGAAGELNALSQLLLKATAPGVPDFYQGTELWTLTLVDPDNRGAVDYGAREKALATILKAPAKALRNALRAPDDGRVKLFATHRLLQHRRARPDLYARGTYIPLEAAGEKRDHVVALARVRDGEASIAMAGRFFYRLTRPSRTSLAPACWGDTLITLRKEVPAGRYRDIFTYRIFEVGYGDNLTLDAKDVLAPLPIALLEKTT